ASSGRDFAAFDLFVDPPGGHWDNSRAFRSGVPPRPTLAFLEQCMSFRHILGLAGMIAAFAASAQGESAATATAVDEPAPAEVAPLTEAHGPAEPGDATRGEAKAATCAACHSVDGNSVDPQYPK